MLLSDFFEKKRKHRIEAAKAEGIAQGKAEAEAKVLNEFAERIEAAQGDTKAEAKVLSKFAEQIEKAKAKGREEGVAEGRIEGAAEVYAKISDELFRIPMQWSDGKIFRLRDNDKLIAIQGQLQETSS